MELAWTHVMNTTFPSGTLLLHSPRLTAFGFMNIGFSSWKLQVARTVGL
jgi:hypothetical protein